MDVQERITQLKQEKFEVLKTIYNELVDYVYAFIENQLEDLAGQINEMPRDISDLSPENILCNITTFSDKDIEQKQKELVKQYGYSYEQLMSDIEEIEAEAEGDGDND